MIKLMIKKRILFVTSRIIPEKLYIKLRYKRKIGYFPDLDNPKSFTEKIQWLKLNDRTNLHTICADKYLVRNFISEEIGIEYLIPLSFQTYNAKDLTLENLPDYPCIIKTNHDSQGSIFVYDKYKIDWKSTQQYFIKKLKTNYYYLEKEWQYKNIKPCIIVEKLLLDKRGNIPNDFKFYCFNGIAKLIQVDKDRGKSIYTRHFYDSQWVKQKFNGDIKDPVTREGNNSNIEIKKPICLNKMIKFSEKIAKRFDFVRVDWYEIEGKLYFGEITFHPNGGFGGFVTEAWDKKYGKLLKLNIHQ